MSSLGSTVMDISTGDEWLGTEETSSTLGTAMDLTQDECPELRSTLTTDSVSIVAMATRSLESGEILTLGRNKRSPAPPRYTRSFLPYWNPFHHKVESMRRSSHGETDNYDEIRQIGSGGFGNCFLIERKTDKALRVCKVQARESCGRSDSDGIPVEVRILKDILPPHDRILRLHGYVLQSYTIQLYYDYYEGGDLYHLICRYFDQWQEFPETFLWHAYLQLSEALAFLHFGYDRNRFGSLPADWISIIHGDIKDRNIFLGPPDPHSNNPLAREYPSLVLGDFGLADFEPSRRWGTPKWQPPELPVTSMKADVWGVGAVMHALAHEGKSPISPIPPPNENLNWAEWCEDPRARDPLPLYELYSTELHGCVFNALELDPNIRYNSYDLHFEVLVTWRDRIAPYCMAITPLIAATEEKSYDENGVTIKQHTDYSDQYYPAESVIRDYQDSIPPPPPPEDKEDIQPPPPPPIEYD